MSIHTTFEIFHSHDSRRYIYQCMYKIYIMVIHIFSIHNQIEILHESISSNRWFVFCELIDVYFCILARLSLPFGYIIFCVSLRINMYIRKTCPCNVYPIESHFYIVKLGYAGVYLFYLFWLQNIDCWYSRSMF